MTELYIYCCGTLDSLSQAAGLISLRYKIVDDRSRTSVAFCVSWSSDCCFHAYFCDKIHLTRHRVGFTLGHSYQQCWDLRAPCSQYLTGCVSTNFRRKNFLHGVCSAFIIGGASAEIVDLRCLSGHRYACKYRSCVVNVIAQLLSSWCTDSTVKGTAKSKLTQTNRSMRSPGFF